MADFQNGDSEKLIHAPNVGSITLREVLRRIEAFLRHMPGLTFVLIVGRQGDTSRVCATRNVPTSVAREMLRTAIDGINEGRIMKVDG